MINTILKSVRTVLSFITLAAIFVTVTPQTASAQFIAATDCSGVFTNVFQDNEPVCALGQATGSFLGAPSLLCILPAGGGGPGDDVTAGGCNAGPAAGAFFDEILWLPPTVPGNYLMVIFNNNGTFATDTIVVNSSGGAAPTVNVAAIKSQANTAALTWAATELFAQNLDDFYSAYSIGMAAATGDFVGAAINIAGAAFGVPTSYNDWVVQQGGIIMSALAGQQRARFASLAADPPDPVFTEIIALDLLAVNVDLAASAPLFPGLPLQYPFANQGQDPLHLANVRLANSIVEQTALVFAFMRTLEKFQGAEIAADDQHILLQAEGLINYTDQLTAQLATTRQYVLDYKAELVIVGLADIVYDSADVNAFNARLVATGLTPDEEQSLRDVGFTDPDLQVIIDRANAYVPASGTYTRAGGLDDIIASIDAMLPVLADVRADAQAVVDFYAPLVTVQHPTADAGGPYNENEGTAVVIDGSGSSDPQVQALSFEWDFDLDGQFDDATGAVVMNTFNAPVATKVGLRVTDTDGNSDIAYADITILEVNGPPVITAFEPAILDPTASSLSPLDFFATATDPDLDALSFEWALDGAVMSSAAGWTYTPGIGETGTRTVRLTVSDLNLLSEDTIQTRLVKLVEEVPVPDVVGLEQTVAEADIIAAGLTVGNVTVETNDTVLEGDVISQNPVGGTVALAGSSVDLVVSIGPETTAVPNVVGLTQADAEAAIVGASLTVGNVTTTTSDTVPAGSVISQNPPAGTSVPVDSAVDFVVSEGPETTVVPPVVGLPQADAQAAIIGAGLTVGNVTTENADTVPAGSVISQNPPSGTSVPVNSAVDLVISEGPADVVVPDVVGLPQANAQAAIVGANLVVGNVTTANSDTVPAGNVISQNPSGGTSVAPNSAVDIVVSEGPADVVVPDVVGLPQANAQAAIVGANLVVGNVTTANSDTVPAGNVISQNPSGGTSVAPNSAVDIVVSEGPADVVVPDVVGLPQANAQAAIVGANLVVGNVTTANSDTVPAGNVISQNPSGGASVAPNSAVDIVVSEGPADVVVPDVVGLPQANAQAAIVGANLVVGNVTTANSDTVPAGNVISQNPSGGASVAPNSAVDIVVSEGPADVVVPDVVGLPQANAQAAIVGANLVVGNVTTANSDTVPAGNVISQNPSGGASVAPNSAVDIVVSEGPANVVVPDVVGLPQGAAEAAIVGANLVVGNVTTANSDTVPAGNVISQNPSGGASVAPNSAVDIVVSDGQAGVAPDKPENLVGRAKQLHVNLGWSGSETATGFNVFRRLDTEIDFVNIGQTGNRAFVDDMPDGTLSAEYFVVAVNNFGMSDPSDIVVVTPRSRR